MTKLEKNILVMAAALFPITMAAANDVPPTTVQEKSWTADNGNGTYTNPLFYDEFSDPDIIRVGEDFYLAGTTMHCTPGVIILHSKDLVNWDFASYCMDKFNMGEEFKLQNGKEAYGQGIWAPCIRYHEGKFYVFSNINGHGMQVFISDKATGPWKHINMGGNIYDLSVLFDDKGKIYAVHQYDEVKLIEIKPDFSGYVEGSERVIIPHGSAMGEGHHIYKINGMYYIISADYSPQGRMQCARSKSIDGPYETRAICVKSSMGTQVGHWENPVSLQSPLPPVGQEFQIADALDNRIQSAAMHQGGIVDLPNGDWWGITMLDFRAVGRTSCLSPITWVDGWPYFGLENNLGRVPRTWTKPRVDVASQPHAPYERSDDFNEKNLKPIWQWNHECADGKWALKEGKLLLNTMPAQDFFWARNTLTQRVIGPVSTATVELDYSKLKNGDVAGLGLLNMPCAWLGVERQGKVVQLKWYKQETESTEKKPIHGRKIYLRVTCNTDTDYAQMSYSLDGQTFTNIGDSIVLPYQMKTFQGPRYSLFAYNQLGKEGGYASFDNFVLQEPQADRSGNLPLSKVITLTNVSNRERMYAFPHGMVYACGAGSQEYDSPACQFRVLDRGNGRVVLEAMNGTGYVTVVGEGLSADVRLIKEETPDCLIQWQDMLNGQCMLLSLKTHRYIGVEPTTGEPYGADFTGPTPNRRNGVVFDWRIVE